MASLTEKKMCTIFTCIILVLVLRLSYAQEHVLPTSSSATDHSFTVSNSASLVVGIDSITLSVQRNASSKTIVLLGSMGHTMATDIMKHCTSNGIHNGKQLCFEWDSGPRVEIYNKNLSQLQSVLDFECFTVSWETAIGAGVTETPEDCFDMSSFFWYGLFEEELQIWPMNDFQLASSPYITGDSYHRHTIGDVIEPMLLSSSGIGIYIEETSPLYISINDNGSKQVCLKGKTGKDTPFFAHSRTYLQYDICKATDIAKLWKGMSEVYLPKPLNYPSLDVIRYPIWTTWASYKENIDQTTVLDFAQKIQQNGLSISQLEIDDDWTPKYGDLDFNPQKFPDAKEMISNLTQMGIPVTIWVHWFFNNDSDAFKELSSSGYMVKEYDSDLPFLVGWWRGTAAGVLDVTNPEAVKWYLNKLKNLQDTYNVTSFKFDAGEMNWLPGRYKVKNPLATANYFSQKYAQVTYQADTVERRQELRTGFKSQASSLMVRMLDRDSNWSHDLGMKTLIPTALVFGLMGYPYVLPDMIGGNAYGETASAELFIRWLQVTTFMPVLQFSIVPWTFNDTVVDITRKFIQLHEQYADKIIELTKNAQQTGEPINRPLWWIAPDDVEALTLDTEFLLGDDLLVAPVLEDGARSRDIYLPQGRWHDELRNVTLDGGQWLRNYAADLDELPYFTKYN